MGAVQLSQSEASKTEPNCGIPQLVEAGVLFAPDLSAKVTHFDFAGPGIILQQHRLTMSDAAHHKVEAGPMVSNRDKIAQAHRVLLAGAQPRGPAQGLRSRITDHLLF